MYVRDRLISRRTPPPPEPTTVPTTPPATQPVAQDLPPRTDLDLVRKTYPKDPTTQPLDQPLGVAYMGRFILPHRAFLDRSSRVWITHPDAPTPAQHPPPLPSRRQTLAPCRPPQVGQRIRPRYVRNRPGANDRAIGI